MTIEQTSNDLKTDSIHIWRIDLDRAVGDLAELLSTEEQKRADAKHLAQERDRFILGRGALRSILGSYLNVSGDELIFTQGEKGKPAIGNPGFNIEFNLTHCEGMALLAVAKTVQIGIDLERIRTRPRQLEVAQRMFPEAIHKKLEQLPSEQLNLAFYRHWTELEARAKCEGAGIFSIDDLQNEITTHHFSPQEGWVACVAAKGADISYQELKYFVHRI